MRSLFQADGYVTLRRRGAYGSARVGFAVVGERWTEDVQLLLASIGVYSRRLRKRERRDGRLDMHEVAISIGSERARFAELVGFVGRDKQQRLRLSLGLSGQKVVPNVREEEIVAIDLLGVEDVYDIQTESGEYLSNNVAVHNCFINSVDDSMSSIMDLAKTEAMLFKYGSGAGVNLSPIRGSRERMSGGGIASGPVSFMKGFDAFAGVVKSGGKTRRAAKMVILDADHPDILDFVESKAAEERKAWALIEAGYDPSFTGEAYGSVFFQNANHSVRASDDFMTAVEVDADWTTREVTTGQPAGTHKARTIFRRMAEAAWICGDPGIQYDTTINDWNPVSSTDRQYATNPCSEFSFLNDTSCNLASLNLMKFVDPEGEFDAEDFRYAARVTITAQEILVDNASYPTPRIEENSHRFRPLGLGYANLGALLMSRGLAYDSDEGRAYAAAITAIMTGEAYRQSAIVARDHGGPFHDYGINERPFLRVIGKHREAAYRIDTGLAPAPLVKAAHQGLGRCPPARRAARLPQRPGDGPRADRNHRVHDGLRHDRHRTGHRAHQVQEARRRGLPEDRQRHRASGVAAPRLLAGRGGGHRGLHRRARDDRGRARPQARAPVGLRLRLQARERRALHPPHGPPAHDERGPTLPLGRHQQDREHARGVPRAEDIEDVYLQGWKLGLKAIAIYRDGSKRSQPLSTGRKKTGRRGDRSVGRARRRASSHSRSRSRIGGDCPTNGGP